MAQAIRSKKLISRLTAQALRKFISHSKGSSYQFEKNHQLFERPELSVGEIHQPFELAWLLFQDKTRQYKTSKTICQALSNDTCRRVYITQTVVTLLFFVYFCLNDTRFIFYGKTF